jgi:hypothetical protein
MAAVVMEAKMDRTNEVEDEFEVLHGSEPTSASANAPPSPRLFYRLCEALCASEPLSEAKALNNAFGLDSKATSGTLARRKKLERSPVVDSRCEAR